MKPYLPKTARKAYERRLKRLVLRVGGAFLLSMIALAFYGQAVGNSAEDVCGDNHRPVAVIEVRRG